VRIWSYWRLDYPEPEPLDESTAIEQTAALLTDAVRLRLRADVPVGAYLSGGLDSSLTVGLIRHRTETPLETFSVTFTDGEFDESEHQRLVVERNATAHHAVACDGSEIGRIFPEVIWHTELPVIRTAPAPLYLLSSLVREQGFKVVVTGEGADEVFGGYDIFKEAKIRRFWHRNPNSLWRPLLLRRLYPYMPALQAQPTAYLKAFFHIADGEPAGPFFSHTPRWEMTRKLRGLFAPEVRDRLAGRDAVDILHSELPTEFGRWHPFCQAQFLETSILLPGYILASQGDRMGMANSVEGRFPFLDHRLVELASRLPPRLKMNVLDEKYLLKRVAEPLVPEAVVRRKKQPYRAPDAVSFFDEGRPRYDYVAELLSERAVADVGLFAPRAVQSLVNKCAGQGKLGVRDNMALVGVLSTQLAVHRFREEFHG
jgi:asparagine synthase (glutamine-hydrolysing)